MLFYIVDKNDKTLCALSSDSTSINSFNFYNDTWTQSLTSPSQLDFNCYGGHKNSKYIEVGNQVIFKYEDEYQLFTIVEVTATHGDTNELDVHCEHASLSLLNTVIYPSKINDTTIENVLGMVLGDTDFKVGEVDYFEHKPYENSGYNTALKEVETIADLFKAELKYRIEFDPTKGITGRFVDAYKRIGRNNGARFEIGNNVSNISKKVDYTTVCTAIIPYGDNNSHCGTATCTKAQHGFDKPNGQRYVALTEDERMEIVGEKSSRHIFGALQCETTDPYTLAVLGWEELQKVKNPTVEYTFNPVILRRNVYIGDTVTCIDRELGLQLQARVNELRLSFTDNSQDSVTLSNYIEVKSSISDQLKKLQDKLNNIELESNVIVGDTMPSNPKEDTVWVNTGHITENGFVIIQTWNPETGQWESSFDGDLKDYPTKEEMAQELQGSADTLVQYIDNEFVKLEMKVYKQDETPTSGVNGQLWLNTGVEPNEWYKYDARTKQWNLLIVAGVDTETTNKVNQVERDVNEIEGILTTKISSVEVENLINVAIESLSGDGKNILLYGACERGILPILESADTTVQYGLTPTVEGGNLKLKVNNANSHYNFGSTGTNGFVNDNYSISFDLEIPTDSTLDVSKIFINFIEDNVEQKTFLNTLEPSQSGRYTLTKEFTNKEATTRQIIIGCEGVTNLSNAYALLDDIKIERGDEATAFTKNPNEFTSAELSTLKERVTTAESKIEQNSQAITSKVEQTTFESYIDTTDTRISEAESTITQHANEIASKVSQTTYDIDVDDLKSRMTGAESSIVQNAENIATKVEQSVFNELGTRVSNAESTIQQNTQQISLKVNQSDFDNLAIGGRNLLLDSKMDKLTDNWTFGDVIIEEPDEGTDEGIEVLAEGLSDEELSFVDGGMLIQKVETEEPYFFVQQSSINANLKDIKFGEKYVISADLRGAGIIGIPSDSKLILRVYYTDETFTDKEFIFPNTLSLNNWKRFYTLIDVTKDELKEVNLEKIQFLIYFGTGAGSIGIKNIQLEEGNKPTAWRENLEVDVYELETRVSNAEFKMNDDSIISTVINSESFQTAFDSKVDYDSIAGFVTQTDIDDAIANADITGTIDNRVLEMLENPESNLNLQYTTKAELEQTASSITQRFQMSNGLNMIQNSLGYHEYYYWEPISGTHKVMIKQDVLAEKITGLSNVWHLAPTGEVNEGSYWVGNRYYFTAKVGQTYTVSAYFKKLNDVGDAGIRVYQNEPQTWVDGKEDDEQHTQKLSTEEYVFKYVTFVAPHESMRVEFIVNYGGETYYTAPMLHEGSIPLAWSLAQGELYNTNVTTDLSGIRVQQTDSNGLVTSYTSITPDEFAGYYRNGNSFERVFWLNDDETHSKKVHATDEISMGNVKIVNVQNSTFNGWAFVTNN